MSPVAETIRRAADLIETEGHVKFTMRGAKGERCMMAALTDARDSRGSAYAAVVERIKPGFGVCMYNNTHSAEEVIAKLREIADAVEKEAVQV